MRSLPITAIKLPKTANAPKPKRGKANAIPMANGRAKTVPWSSAASLIQYASGWAGDDLPKLLEFVRQTRGKTRF